MTIKHQEFFDSLEDTIKLCYRSLVDYRTRCLREKVLDRYKRQDLNVIRNDLNHILIKIELLKNSLPEDPYEFPKEDLELEIPF